MNCLTCTRNCPQNGWPFCQIIEGFPVVDGDGEADSCPLEDGAESKLALL